MMYQCTSIVGEKGTVYSAYHRDASYARLDTESDAGYFWEYEYKLYYNIIGGILHYCNEPGPSGYTKMRLARAGDNPLSYHRQVVFDLTNDEFVFPTWLHKVSQASGYELEERGTSFDYVFRSLNTSINDIDK